MGNETHNHYKVFTHTFSFMARGEIQWHRTQSGLPVHFG